MAVHSQSSLLLMVMLLVHAVLMIVEGSTYIGVNEVLTWAEANAYCEANFNTELATIRSDDENQAVRDAATEAGIATTTVNGWIWIGFYDFGGNGSFGWADGVTPAEYTNWTPGEPNFIGFELCTIQYSGTTIRWDNTGCSNKRRFVCNGDGTPTNEPTAAPSTTAEGVVATVFSLECDSDPCSVEDSGNCAVYNEGTGCSQCESGSFTFGNGYACVECDSIFGDGGCQHCANGNGCQQCDTSNGYYLDTLYISDLDLTVSYCEEGPCHANNVGETHCQSCNNEVCSQCEDGYFGVNDADSGLICKDCKDSDVIGSECQFCSNYVGCQQCANGESLVNMVNEQNGLTYNQCP